MPPGNPSPAAAVIGTTPLDSLEGTMRKSATNDDVLSTREAAERLGVALRTVQLWVESGILPAWKTAGGHRRISRAAVERLIGERSAALSGVASPRRLAPGLAAEAADTRLKVMVVEDEPELLRLFTLVIAGWGLPVEVTPAGDGFDALLRMGQHCPDLLITDLNMPGMDGFRMIAALLAAGEAFADLEIVVVTALSPADIERRGGLPAEVRVWHKPVPFGELEALVRERVAALAATA
jgi:excisionase family DNA binding protein